MPNVADVSAACAMVSVIVTHWNDEETTAECLHRLEKGKLAGQEVILVDSGSTDGSGVRLMARFPWVKLVTLAENRGHAHAANVGAANVQQGHPKYLFFLDNDAFVEPSCLCRLVERMEEQPRSALAAPLILSGRRPGRIWYGGGRITLFGNSRHTGMSRELNKVSLTPGEVTYASSCALLARREVFEKLGGFNEVLISYSEDLELSIRVRQQSYVILFEPEARVTHGESRNVLKVAGKRFRDYYTLRNRLYIIQTYGTIFQRTVGLTCTAVWYGLLYCVAFTITGQLDRAKALIRGMHDFAVGRMGWRVM